MKNTKKEIYCFVLCMLLLGCSNAKESQNTSQPDIDEFRTYAIDVALKPSSIFDLISEVEIMRLQETENSFLKDVYQVSEIEGEYVISSPSTGDNYFFSENGAFLRAFNHSGIGPKEYAYTLNSWVSNDRLYLFDPQNMRVQQYNKYGEWQEAKRLPFATLSLAYHNQQYFLDVSKNPIGNESYAVAVLNDDMKLVQQEILYKKLKTMVLTFGVDQFRRYGQNLVYNDAMNDTVYLYRKNHFEPLYALDFGDHWIWKGQALFSDPEKANALLSRRDMIGAFGVHTGSSFLYLQYAFDAKLQNTLINRNSGKVWRLKDTEGIIPIRWDKERLLVSLRSTSVEAFLLGLSKEQTVLRAGTTLEEIESSENPVLMWVKFR